MILGRSQRNFQLESKDNLIDVLPVAESEFYKNEIINE